MADKFAFYRAKAQELDGLDPMGCFRDLFHIPEGMIYMDGNSLGLAPKAAEAALHRAFAEWRDLGIGGWLEGTPPWFHLAAEAGEMMAPLMGAASVEMVMSTSITINLQALVSTFYKPSGK